MAMLTVRNLPDDVHRALRVRAAQHGHSIEAEVREILAMAVKPESRVRVGDALAALGRQIGLSNEDFEIFELVRLADYRQVPGSPATVSSGRHLWPGRPADSAIDTGRVGGSNGRCAATTGRCIEDRDADLPGAACG